MVFGCFGSVADELHFCLCPGLVASRFVPTYLPTYCGPLPVCFNGFEGAVSAACGRVANAPFFGLPELGFRWCLAVSDPLPTSFIFAFVQAWLRHGFCPPICPPTAVLYLSVLTVSKVQFQQCGRVANAPFFGLPELGFRWCLAVSDPLPTSFIFAFVQAWLRHGFCPPIRPPTAVLNLSVLTVSKVQFQQRVEGLRTHRFLPCLSSDLGVSEPLSRSFIFAFVQVRLPHVFCPPICPPAAVLNLSVLTVSKVQFQHRVEGLRAHHFLPCLSSDLGGVWLFRIRCRRASFLPLSRLGCATYCGPLPVCFNGFEGAVSAACGRVANAPFFALPELGFRWCLAVSDPLPTSFIFAFVQAWLRHGFCPPICPPTAVLYLSVLTVLA